jgi:hypothetical protein
MGDTDRQARWGTACSESRRVIPVPHDLPAQGSDIVGARRGTSHRSHPHRISRASSRSIPWCDQPPRAVSSATCCSARSSSQIPRFAALWRRYVCHRRFRVPA